MILFTECTWWRRTDFYRLRPGTIGGKPYWLAEGDDGQTYHFYHVNEPHDGWVVGTDLQSFILIVESYEATPPWGTHEWNEICAGQQQEVRVIKLTPTCPRRPGAIKSH